MKLVEQTAEHDVAFRAFATSLGEYAQDLSYGYYGPHPGISVRRHLLVEAKGDISAVIGAVTSKEQTYVVQGERLRVAVFTYPVTLGVVNPRYAAAAIVLMRKMLEAYPINFLLVGSPQTNPTGRLCEMLGWRVDAIAYLFLPLRFGALLAKRLRNKPLAAVAVRIAKTTGVFWPVEAALRVYRRRRTPQRVDTESVRMFGAELNAWWNRVESVFGFTLVRDAAQMNAMYPPERPEFERLLLKVDDRVVGFAVLLIPTVKESLAVFGANVATLVEFIAEEALLSPAAAALGEYLSGHQQDAVICNHAHVATAQALRDAGFKDRKTEMYFAASPALQQLLSCKGLDLDKCIITRGDGDGPIGLGVML